MTADRILVFAKAPAAGRVKTRLTPPLPPDEAAAVYEACLRDVVALCARERARVELWYHDDGAAAAYFGLEFPHLAQTAQCDGHLGAKLHDAFARSFRDGAQRILIVGSDVPTMPESVLNAAVAALRDAGMVIGPTLDGGYYVIGFTAQAWLGGQVVLRDVAWSTDTVFRVTVDKAVSAGLRLHVLPGWYDVDTIDDLRQALLDAQPESNLARWGARPEAVHFINAG